jgi:hypothetical protein
MAAPAVLVFLVAGHQVVLMEVRLVIPLLLDTVVAAVAVEQILLTLLCVVAGVVVIAKN